MVFHGKISSTTRSLVMLLGMDNKYSSREIAAKTGISKSTVARLLKDPIRRGERHEKKCATIGRPKKFSERDRRHLLHDLNRLRKANANFTWKELLIYSGLQSTGVSYGTFYREIKCLGFHYLQARKKGVLTSRDCTKRQQFARKCRKILKSKPNFFHKNIAFYLDGVSFVCKSKPMQDAVAPKGKIWRKRSEGLQITSKGSKELPGGKRLYLLVERI